MKKTQLALLLLAGAVLMAGLGVMLLPKDVVIQIGADGQPANVVSKGVALLIPAVLSIGGAAMAWLGDDSMKKKGIAVSAAGYFVAIASMILSFIF